MADDLTVRVGLDAEGYLRGVAGMERSTQSFERSLQRLASNVSSQVSRGMSIMNRLDLSTVAVTQATERAAEAQRRYDGAVAQFGKSSDEAVKAHKELAEAQEAVDRANQRAHISNVLIAADLVTMAAKLPKTISLVKDLAAGQTAAATAGKTLALSLGPLAAGVVALGGAYELYKFNVDHATESAEHLNAVQKAIVEHVPHWEGPAWLKPGKGVEGLLESQKVIEDVSLKNTILAEDFMAGEQRKAAVAAGSELAIRAELEKTRQALDATSAAMGQATSKAEFEGLEKRWQSLSAEATNYEKRLEQVMAGITASTKTGFSSLGINLSSFSIGFQDQMLRNAGVAEEFIQSLHAVVDVEKLLRETSGKTGEALRAQASITAHKDETTAEFTERLRTLGFTEEEIRQRVDETGRALLSQAEATRRASQATSAASGGSGGASGSGFSSNLGAFIELNQKEFLKAIGKQMNHPLANNDFVLDQWAGSFDGNAIADILQGRDKRGSEASMRGLGWIGEFGSDRRNAFLDALVKSIQGNLPSTAWDSMLGSIGVKNVTGPQSTRMNQFTPGSIVVYANTSQGGADAATALARELKRLGVTA